ncbi:MAG: hypothetical protein RLZZ297_1881, partial [Chloroflexota bacterium]
FVWVSCGAMSAALIYRKGYHMAAAVAIGLLLGPLSLLIGVLLPIRERPPR